MMDNSTAAIGMFDSGLGGLTVMHQLVQALPNEEVIYFGDTARLPYGDKSPETIIRYSIENAIFLIEQKIKMLVVACSTATSHALDHLQQTFNIPIIGAIEPGAEQATKTSKNERIAVLGTKGTISSRSYEKALLARNPKAYVLPIACPLFVPLVEEHFVKHPAAQLIVHEYLKVIKDHRIDTLILGCTHYPLLKNLIAAEVGEHITIIDSAAACATYAASLLSDKGLLRHSSEVVQHRYFVSDDPHRFQMLGREFLGLPIDHVHLK